MPSYSSARKRVAVERMMNESRKAEVDRAAELEAARLERARTWLREYLATPRQQAEAHDRVDEMPPPATDLRG